MQVVKAEESLLPRYLFQVLNHVNLLFVPSVLLMIQCWWMWFFVCISVIVFIVIWIVNIDSITLCFDNFEPHLYILIINNLSFRYELCFIMEKVVKVPATPYLHGAETYNSHHSNGERNVLDGESTMVDIFRWSRCKRPLPQKIMQNLGIPLPIEYLEVNISGPSFLSKCKTCKCYTFLLSFIWWGMLYIEYLLVWVGVGG